MKVCWVASEEDDAKTAHRLWRNELLPGLLPSTLPTPNDYAAASGLVTEDMVREHVACGLDPERYLQQLQQFADAGFDEVYVQQIGPNQDEFFDAWKSAVLPAL